MSKTITILMAIAFALVAIAAGASKEAGGTQARVSEDRAEAPTQYDFENAVQQAILE